MGDVARCSIGRPCDYHNEELLYRLFGVNAELLIDHAWGWEPCTIADIRAYRPATNSISSGQVLSCPYSCDKARLVIREMADALALDLVDRGLVTGQLVLTVGYDSSNLHDPQKSGRYHGEVSTDAYGRKIPKHAHGTVNLERQTASSRLLTEAVMELYDRIINPELLIRRINLTAAHVVDESSATTKETYEQLDLFTDYAKLEEQRKKEEEALLRERKLQNAMLDIKKKFGKNAILKGTNLEEGATAMERNQQIGGHKA
jgi:DNA polymerase V